MLARVKRFFNAVVMAVKVKGPKLLTSLVPGGEFAYELGAELVNQLRGLPAAEARGDLEAVLQDAQEVIGQAADEAVNEADIDLTAAQKDDLKTLLKLIPETAKRSLQRPDDLAGRTVPLDFSFHSAASISRIIPDSLPKMKAGDQPTRDGNWVLLRLLGKGGFGEAWLARHRQSARMEKVFKFCTDTTAQSLLKHESRMVEQVLASGSHPGIVTLEDMDLETTIPWLRYEYIKGGELGGLIHRLNKEPIAKRVDFAIRAMLLLARSTGYFHNLEPAVVHCDLKPANILVENKRLKITDFGIGRAAARRALDQAKLATLSIESLPTAVRGAHTPIYASPQQQDGKDADVRDDVYSLGVIWYQMLLGDTRARRPGGGGWKNALKKQSVPSAHIDLMENCFDDLPDARPGNGTVLAKLIEPLLAPSLSKEVRETKKQDPTLAEIADRNRREREDIHSRARALEKRGFYAEALTELENLAADRRDKSFFNSLVERRDESADLQQEIGDAAHRDQLAWWHRAKLERWKSLQPEHARQADVDGMLKLIPEIPARFTNSLNMPLVLIPSGAFWMGGGRGKCGDKQVTIADSFYLGIYPVTQAQWQSLMGNNPSHCHSGNNGGPDHPVVQVSWNDVQEFLRKMNAHEGANGWIYRLPTEAEWEYACRGGTTSKESCSFDFYFADPKTHKPILTNNLSSDMANFNGESPCGSGQMGTYLEQTTVVGSYNPNVLGLFDMHGNVWEWCADNFDGGTDRVCRGGSWYDDGEYCRAATRSSDDPANQNDGLGFRLARVPTDR